MSERLRILHAIRSDGFAGVEQFVLRLARAQQQRGDEVTVIGGATEPMRAGLDPVGVGHVPAARTDDVTRAVRRLARDVDVVNTHMTAADLGTVLALAPRRTRPSVVATRHFAKPRGRIGPVPLAVDRPARHRRADRDQHRRRGHDRRAEHGRASGHRRPPRPRHAVA